MHHADVPQGAVHGNNGKYPHPYITKFPYVFAKVYYDYVSLHQMVSACMCHTVSVSVLMDSDSSIVAFL